MNKMDIIWRLLGSTAGIWYLWKLGQWIYLKLNFKKLYYAHKVYPISKEKYFHVMAIWNPTFHDILENDVTSTITLPIGLSGDRQFHVCNYTDKNLIKALQFSENFNMQVVCNPFPKRSGIVFSYISDFPHESVKGEIKNRQLTEVNYNESVWHFGTFMSLFMTPWIIFSFEIGKKAFGFACCIYLLIVFCVFYLESYFYHPRMPNALWNTFKGLRIWMRD